MNPLDQIAALVEHASGIVLRAPQLDALASAVGRAEPSGDLAAFLRRTADPVEGPTRLAGLLDEVTVRETFFLRDRQQFGRIPWAELFARARAEGGRDVRIWSAACASGEEAYTLALLACEAYGTDTPPVRVFATDISPAALEEARTGSYRPRSTRDLDAGQRERYFTVDGERLAVAPELRAPVSFALHNLVHDPFPPRGELPFDLVLCRNVLIYFDPTTAERVATSLLRALAPGGTLILGSADVLCRGAARLGGLAAPVAPRLQLRAAEERQTTRAVGEIVAAPATAMASAGSPASEEAAVDPLDASAHFLAGLAELESGDAEAAVRDLRKALYAEPALGVAAFELGRAYETLGYLSAASRAYAQALRTCATGEDPCAALLDQVDVADVIAAAATRIDALSAIGIGR